MKLAVGHYTRRMDPRHRITIPRQIFGALTSGIPTLNAINVEEDGLRRTELYEPKDRNSRIVLPIETSHRIVLPEEVRKFLGLTNLVTISGDTDRINLWRPAVFQSYQEKYSYLRW